MIRAETRNGVRLLRMELGSGNALGATAIQAITTALDAEQRPTVLTGEGHIFSAGLNLVELAAYSRDEIASLVETFSVLMTRTLTTRYPLVAAVNGHAVAGGCVLAMACDRRIGTRGDYKIGMNEMAIGLTLPAVVTEILRDKLAPEQARTVILGGALYNPEEAQRAGLLDSVADSAGEAIDRACEVARDLDKSPAEFAAMKGSLTAPIMERFQQTRRALDRRFVDSWFAPTASELRQKMLDRLQSR
jgi:enoyl-CoA hydratase